MLLSWVLLVGFSRTPLNRTTVSLASIMFLLTVTMLQSEPRYNKPCYTKTPLYGRKVPEQL